MEKYLKQNIFFVKSSTTIESDIFPLRLIEADT